MEFIENLSQINKEDVARVGGKGASLGELVQAGFVVPDGFVITTRVYDTYAENGSGNMPENVKTEILNAFEKLGASHVAVRSSATVEDSATDAWAGQLESYLNTTKENFLENVKKCWDSISSPRAVAYRNEKGLHDKKISVAVVVQKMIQSEISGIAFSVHPITQNRNHIIIEAGFGLGESIVSGTVTPDSYVIEKDTRKMINAQINTQTKGLFGMERGGNEWREIQEPEASSQVLDEVKILELTDLVIRIEKHYGFPCDIEWAYENGKFYTIQSRPITTLKDKSLDSQNIFEGSIMVSMGKRLANLHEASLKVIARSKIWETELGAGYKTAIMNSLGEYYVDKESRGKVNDILKTKDIAYAETYIEKLYNLRSKLLEEVAQNPFQDFTEGFTRMIAYFFIIKSVFETIYTKSTPEEQKIIEKWRNDETLFDPLELYYKSHPEEDEKSDKEWSLVFSNGALSFHDKKISFSIENVKTVELEETQFGIIQTINGNSAYPGIVRGKARLVLSKEDKDLVEEGEIIVAPMTTVDFMSIMKKAAAFVTDEGGITSHAAIVAREMKKPCIIGTKIATQVLKTGDMVEVDADNGIVRILK